ncbi:MAG: Maf family protein [bacterium]
MKIILASASPRRKKLLKTMGVKFRILQPHIRETVPKGLSNCQQAVFLALKKAKNVARRVKNSIILGADTLVVCKGKIIGKPRDVDDSARMLKILSGSKHRVITGFALVDQLRNKTSCGYDESFVFFREIPSKKLKIIGKKHLDKAGAYAIQSKKDRFVRRLSGSYNNVVGLPTEKLSKLFEKLKLKLK